MHRNDKSKFLLYIEPKKEEKSKEPIDDILTQLITTAMTESTGGSANYSHINEKEKFQNGAWRGWHNTDCGEKSSGHDYLLKNGLITNSLSTFYVRWYRDSIHENDWNKLVELGKFYDVNIQLPEKFSNSPASTKPKTYDDHMKDMENMMVGELAKTIEKNILKRLENLRNSGS